MTDTETTSTSATGTFADELMLLGQQYQDEQLRATWRSQLVADATLYYLNTLLASDAAWAAFQEAARTNVRSSGKRTVSLLTWQGRGPSYQGQYLTDLLDLDELLQKLQDVLDLRGGRDRFLIFKHPVPASRGPRSFSLTVSWDESRFDNARDIISGEREKAEQRVERNMRRRLAHDEDDEGGDHRPQRRPARREQSDNHRPQRQYRRDGDERPAPGPPRRRDENYDRSNERRAPRRRPARYDE